MTDLFFQSIFADNLVLSFFLGVCTFLAVSYTHLTLPTFVRECR